MSLTEEIELSFFRFLNGEISLEDFEQWIYATPELETYLGEATYFEFAAFDFRQSGAKYELGKLIEVHGFLPKFYTWKLKQQLQSLLDHTMDPVNVFEDFYELYCHGYSFLQNLGMQYMYLGMYEIPKRIAQNRWSEEENNHFIVSLEERISSLKQEIEVLVGSLESGELKIINQHEYEIGPTLAKKLDEFEQKYNTLPIKHEVLRKEKKWWQFWK